MRDGQWEVDGRGLTEQAREFAAGKVVHLRLTKVDGSVARGACEDPGALGQWWTGVPAEVTCGECRETLFRRGPTADPAVQSTPEEFLAWLLGIPPARQLEVVTTVLGQARLGHDCHLFDHVRRLEEWRERTAELLGRLEAVGLTADEEQPGG